MSVGLFASLLKFHLDINVDYKKNHNSNRQVVTIARGAVVIGDISQSNVSSQVIDGNAIDASSRIIAEVSRQFNNNSKLIRDFYMAAGVESSHVSLGRLEKADMCNIMLLQQHACTEMPLLAQKLNRVAGDIGTILEEHKELKKFTKKLKPLTTSCVFTDHEFKALFDKSLLSRKEIAISEIASMAMKELSSMNPNELNYLFEASKKAYKKDKYLIRAQKIFEVAASSCGRSLAAAIRVPAALDVSSDSASSASSSPKEGPSITFTPVTSDGVDYQLRREKTIECITHYLYWILKAFELEDEEEDFYRQEIARTRANAEDHNANWKTDRLSRGGLQSIGTTPDVLELLMDHMGFEDGSGLEVIGYISQRPDVKWEHIPQEVKDRFKNVATMLYDRKLLPQYIIDFIPKEPELMEARDRAAYVDFQNEFFGVKGGDENEIDLRQGLIDAGCDLKPFSYMPRWIIELLLTYERFYPRPGAWTPGELQSYRMEEGSRWAFYNVKDYVFSLPKSMAFYPEWKKASDVKRAALLKKEQEHEEWVERELGYSIKVHHFRAVRQTDLA